MPLASSSLRGRATIPGTPGTPSITSQASGSIGLSWTAPSFTGGAPLTNYLLEYSTNGGSSWSTYSHAAGWATSITTTGLADYLTYIWRVSAINAVGTGSVSANSSGASQFNAASGGTENTVPNYNGTGQTWKTHTFSTNTNFVVTRAITPFRILTVGGGAGGQGKTNSCCGGTGCERGASAGGGGNNYVNDTDTLTATTYAIVVGGGGAGGATGCCDACNPASGCCPGGGGKAGSPGGASTIASARTGAGGAPSTWPSSPTNYLITNTITGSSIQYGANGGAANSGTGGPGTVIFSYRTA